VVVQIEGPLRLRRILASVRALAAAAAAGAPAAWAGPAPDGRGGAVQAAQQALAAALADSTGVSQLEPQPAVPAPAAQPSGGAREPAPAARASAHAPAARQARARGAPSRTPGVAGAMHVLSLPSWC